MELNLFGQHTVILGLKGSGKSNLVAHILAQEQYRNNLVFDVTREHDEEHINRVMPDSRSGDAIKQQFDTVVRAFVTENDRSIRPDLLVGEELSRYAPSSGATPDSLLDLIDLNRHYGTGFLGVARRAAKIDTNLTELADNLIIFRIAGKNDRSRLNAEAEGLGDAARELGRYEFIVVDKFRDWEVHAPVPEYDTTGRL